jgi:hypothetical protein
MRRDEERMDTGTPSDEERTTYVPELETLMDIDGQESSTWREQVATARKKKFGDPKKLYAEGKDAKIPIPSITFKMGEVERCRKAMEIARRKIKDPQQLAHMEYRIRAKAQKRAWKKAGTAQTQAEMDVVNEIKKEIVEMKL